MVVPVYPTLSGLTYPVMRSPAWNNDVQVSVNSKKTSVGYFIYPVWHWKLTYEFLRNGTFQRTAFVEIQQLMAFFNSVGGGRDVFQYTDPDDNSVTLQNFGTGDGTTTEFQLARTMAGASFSFTEPIFAPTGTPAIFKNSVAQTAGVDYTLGATGGIDFASAPANASVLQWTGTYNFFVRFDDDMMDFEKFMSNLWRTQTVNFSSEKI